MSCFQSVSKKKKKCSCPRLPGGRRKGHNECAGAGHGSPSSPQVDNRRLEVVVDGLPLFRGAQLAIDTTMVSPVRSDGTARRQCAATSREQFWTKPGGGRSALTRAGSASRRARLVVLGCEVGGRWSEETRQFLTGLVAAKARSEPEIMRKSTMLCGLGDGAFSWRVLHQGRFLCLCWTVSVVLQLMAPLPRPLRWWPTTSMKWVACEELRIVSLFWFLS